MPWFYYFAKVLIIGLLKLLTRWQIRGGENIPTRGPLLIVANHLSLADPPLLGVSLSRKVFFMAKQELFRFRLAGYFIGSLGAFPVHRGRMDRQAIRQAHQVLVDNSALVMFPEGTRSENSQLRSAFPGPALIAVHSGAPILPVGITGTERFKGVDWLLHRPRVIVNVGRPFYPSVVGRRPTKAELTQLTSLIMDHIAGLLPPKYRGCYGGGQLGENED